jgi:nicotinate-nucleotide pyrophosphorylase (carboxylating)
MIEPHPASVSVMLSLSKHPLLSEPLVRAALAEDLGRAGDLTTDAIVPDGASARAAIVARREGVLAGLETALLAFTLLDPQMRITRARRDGEPIARGETVATLEGSARALLTGERTALNLLCRLCGIASATRRLVDAVAGYRATVVDTRKTTPGLRALEKYAVRAGGGGNHRFGLDDAVLIKDNHVAFAGGVREAVLRARAGVGHLVKIELEVDTLDQVREARTLPIDAILFDNMSPDTMREAIAILEGRFLTEASGSVTAETIVPIAASGVDLISVGWLTHSVTALDLGLDFLPSA